MYLVFIIVKKCIGIILLFLVWEIFKKYEIVILGNY